MTLVIPWVPPREVQVDHLAPELTLAGGRTALRPARWKSTRISLKTEWGTDGGLLTKELEVLSGLLHPNILLLMATTCEPNNSLQLIFEEVAHGSLYQCLHQRPIVPNLALLLNRVDVLLQVTSALSFLHSCHLVHTQISSHAVMMVGGRQIAKLALFEGVVRSGVKFRPQRRWAYDENLPWAAPELVAGGGMADPRSDVYSLCCLVWEAVTCRVPWHGLDAEEVEQEVEKGSRLPLRGLPRYLRRLLRQGLLWKVSERDLDLQEVTDMLLVTRRTEEEKLGVAANKACQDVRMAERDLINQNGQPLQDEEDDQSNWQRSTGGRSKSSLTISESRNGLRENFMLQRAQSDITAHFLSANKQLCFPRPASDMTHSTSPNLKRNANPTVKHTTNPPHSTANNPPQTRPTSSQVSLKPRAHNYFAKFKGKGKTFLTREGKPVQDAAGTDNVVDEILPNFREVRSRFESLSLPSLVEVKKAEKQPTHFSLDEDAGTPATTRHLPGNLESRKKTTELALFVEEKSFLKDKELCAESPHGSGRVRELIRIIDTDFSKGHSNSSERSPQFVTANLPPETPKPERPGTKLVSKLVPPALEDVKTPPSILKAFRRPAFSPSECGSPLLSGQAPWHGPGRRCTSTPLEREKAKGINFAVSLGRQASFRTAMSLAEETEEDAAAFESCVGEVSTPKANIVTFNSSVEEFSASSLASRNSVENEKGQLAWPESPVKSVGTSDDLYCDDDELFSPHMQLIGDENSSLAHLATDEKNSAEATTQTEDSSFSLMNNIGGVQPDDPARLVVSHEGPGRVEESLCFNSFTGQSNELDIGSHEKVNRDKGGSGVQEAQEDVALALEAHFQYSKTKEGCGQDNPIEVEDDFESNNVRGRVDSRGRETDEAQDRVEAYETEEGDIDMATCLDSSSSRRRDIQSIQGEGAEIEDLSFRLVGDLAQGGGAEDVVGGAGLGGDRLTSSNYDCESEAAESERPENASEGAVEDFRSFKVDATLNENAQDGEEEENLFQSYPATQLHESAEEEAVEGHEEVDGKEGWRAGDLCVAPWEEEQDGDGCWYHAQVDAIQGETAHVTFVDYGNSASCEVHKLQPNNAIIGEDGQLREKLPATN